MIIKAITAMELETVMIIMSSVSKINAIDTAARKTPRYKLALLRRNWVNSARIILLYLLSKISMDAKVKNMIIRV